MRLPVKKIGRHATATAIMTRKSKCSIARVWVIPSGVKMLAVPSTPMRLNKLPPMSLPTAREPSPAIAVLTLTVNSGELVSKATIVKPTARG